MNTVRTCSLILLIQTSTHIPMIAPPAWLDGDYPPYLPLPLGPPVALTLEDSRHYALSSADADAEWESVYPGGGLGFVRLGPHKRFFSLSMFHQMHCLDSLRRAVLGREHSHGAREGGSGEEEVLHGRDVEHSAHCLNYLRQTVLCAADLTLEPEIGEEGSQEVGEGLGVTHVCRDWGKVYDFAKRNWEQWEAGKVNISRTNRS
ncbi:hypothetical protein BDW22DRAFT_1357718 [Trametopsis cervina]|nr:hypothetical protein BDW22DRAFT_1357718 [Trametopsis cervina]